MDGQHTISSWPLTSLTQMFQGGCQYQIIGFGAIGFLDNYLHMWLCNGSFVLRCDHSALTFLLGWNLAWIALLQRSLYFVTWCYSRTPLWSYYQGLFLNGSIFIKGFCYLFLVVVVLFPCFFQISCWRCTFHQGSVCWSLDILHVRAPEGFW